MVYQMQRIGKGEMGNPAAMALRRVAVQNDATAIIWAGLPAEERQRLEQEERAAIAQAQQAQHLACPPLHENINSSNASNESSPTDFWAAFQHCPVPMALANLGGSLIECNELFCQFTRQSRDKTLLKTIFDFTAKEDLPDTFERISEWLSTSSPAENLGSTSTTSMSSMSDQGNNTNENGGNSRLEPIIVRTCPKYRNGITVSAASGTPPATHDGRTSNVATTAFQVCLTPIKDPQDPRTLRYVCVTLIRNDDNYGSITPLHQCSLPMIWSPTATSSVSSTQTKRHVVVQDEEQDYCPPKREQKKSEFVAIG